MFEALKILFTLGIVLALLMMPKQVEKMHADFALRRGDTTAIQRVNREWEKRLERDRVRLDSTLQSIVKGN